MPGMFENDLSHVPIEEGVVERGHAFDIVEQGATKAESLIPDSPPPAVEFHPAGSGMQDRYPQVNLNPVAESWKLRRWLRRTRDDADASQTQVAAAMDCSPSKIIRIENGDVGVSQNDLKFLLGYYGIDDPVKEELLAMLKATKAPAWWSEHKDVVTDDLERHIGYESMAAQLSIHDGFAVPFILQTPDYAKAMTTSFRPDLWPRGVDRVADLLMRRQNVIFHSEARSIRVILGHAALRREVGGPDVLYEQLDSLREAVQKSDVDIRVMPFTAGPYPGIGGPPYTAMKLDEEARATFTQTPLGELVLDEKETATSALLGVFESAWNWPGALEGEDLAALILKEQARLRGSSPKPVIK